MKKLSLFFLLVACLYGHAQPGTWTWVSGDSTIYGIGNYGTLGVPSTSNYPPPRYAAGFWTDTAGNFWLYGGAHDYRSDLWTFNPNTLEWTWFGGSDTGSHMVIAAPKGVYSNNNWPGPYGYGIFTWVTSDNHFWMYGGETQHTLGSQILWQYDPAIHQWAWMGGLNSGSGRVDSARVNIEDSINTPGERFESNVAWVDSNNNLWLYGGSTWWDGDFVVYPDLWEYDTHTNYWVCRNAGRLYNYGTKGVASTNNYPPGTLTNFFWKDTHGNFWLGGGVGYFSIGGTGNPYQDIWKFNPSARTWTWTGGITGYDDDSTFAIGLCDTSVRNIIGPRYENRAVWKICDDLIINAGQIEKPKNDLWAYVISTDKWIKINDWPDTAHFGTKLVGNTANHPSARMGPASWMDRKGNLWYFGGFSTNPAITEGDLNDLWKYVLDTACLANYCNCWPGPSVNPLVVRTSAISSSCSLPCNGRAQAIIISGNAPYHYLWSPGGDTSYIDTGLCAGNYVVRITDAAGNVLFDTLTVTAPNPTIVTINPDTVIICTGDTATLCAPPGFGVYDWSNGASGMCTTTQSAGNYNVTVTDKNACKEISNNANVSIMASHPDTVTYHGDTLYSSAANSYQWYLNGVPINGATSQIYIAPTGGSYSVKGTYLNGCSDMSNTISLNVTGLNYLSDDAITVWPNPTTGTWQVTIDNALVNSDIKIFDVQGKLIYEVKAPSQNFEININVASGVYLLTIQSPLKSYYKKLVKL